MTQTIFPMIAYADAATAMDWLEHAFGFRQGNRVTDKEGRVTHGELEVSGAKIFVATPTKDYQGPLRHAEACEAARRWSSVPWIIDGVLVYVDDVDAHFRTAKAAGATILSDLETGGAGWQYRAADLEGHRWMFAQRAKS
ncbi:MAG TPA: VOC family protein [Candidatus Acidoferrales bacterium]|nr:VOC family protein [Candidatus Acidoferrales bacterium]